MNYPTKIDNHDTQCYPSTPDSLSLPRDLTNACMHADGSTAAPAISNNDNLYRHPA